MLIRWFHSALATALLTALCVGNGYASEQALEPIDRELPAFSLQGVGGELYDPEALKGKTWLINFWAVWCAPCLEELPSLNKAWEKLQHHDVGMLAINIGEDADKIEKFLKDNDLRIDFPIVIGDKIRTLGNWSAHALPHTVVVSPQGRVVFEAAGPREWDEQGLIDSIVALSGSDNPSE